MKITDTQSNYSKGALTHHPKNRAVVSFPSVRLVRSPRGIRLLRKPMDDAAISADTVIIVHADGELNGKQFTICSHKTATGSFMKNGSRLNCFHNEERYLTAKVMCCSKNSPNDSANFSSESDLQNCAADGETIVSRIQSILRGLGRSLNKQCKNRS